jgi:hypothetical protein
MNKRRRLFGVFFMTRIKDDMDDLNRVLVLLKIVADGVAIMNKHEFIND